MISPSKENIEKNKNVHKVMKRCGFLSTLIREGFFDLVSMGEGEDSSCARLNPHQRPENVLRM